MPGIEFRVKPDRIRNWPKQERPRERLVADGPERLTDAELLAIVLRTGRGTFKAGVPGDTALTLARSLLASYKGLFGLDRTDVRELLLAPGISLAKASQVKAAFELGKRLRVATSKPRQFHASSDVAEFLAPRLRMAPRETVVALFLDGENHLLEEKVIAEGTPTQATVYTRQIVEAALRASAAAIVMAHNHPSGDSSPSPGDDETTHDLDRGTALLGLVLVDHIILGRTDHFSYADSGRLQQLRDEG